MGANELASIVTQRVQLQLGSQMMQIIQLQAEKEAAEQALAAAQTRLEVSE